MTVKRIEVGPLMTGAVVHGNTVYLSGQTGSGATVTEQAKDCLAKVDRLLAAAGSDKSKLLQTLIYLKDMGDFAEMNSVWKDWIDPANPPARATSQAELAKPEILVEFTVTAALD
ncbi:RidA family protein [Martelella lutilitoris]|uniref:RidA family protein n=1 Tax=Martelella lutilitoris TaxID=2583532 RepID=A0A5C4JM67_9HYPH|nr:RidA family protein [Martelella lutilitoris]TNB46585.1 RidA family protein [Martelella lutilitoris]